MIEIYQYAYNKIEIDYSNSMRYKFKMKYKSKKQYNNQTSCVTNPKYPKSLKPKNTKGYDEISSNLLKIRAVFISSSLNFICNASLSSKIFLNAENTL